MALNCTQSIGYVSLVIIMAVGIEGILRNEMISSYDNDLSTMMCVISPHHSETHRAMLLRLSIPGTPHWGDIVIWDEEEVAS